MMEKHQINRRSPWSKAKVISPKKSICRKWRFADQIDWDRIDLKQALKNLQDNPDTPDFMRDLVSGCFTILHAIKQAMIKSLSN